MLNIDSNVMVYITLIGVHMIARTHDKEKAIYLRRKGLTYSEILKEIPVAKATLSLWLRGVGLARKQKQKITRKRIEAQKRGARTVRENRINGTILIKEKARKEIQEIRVDTLKQLGAMLYWAEGEKQKETAISARVSLGNSDLKIIKVYLLWLDSICGIEKDDLEFRLYIHETADEDKAKKYWSKNLKITADRFNKTILKQHNPKTNRRFDNHNYHGLLKVTVKKSTDLNRKIAGWIDGIYDKLDLR